MDKKSLNNFLKKIKNVKVCIIGDVMLDTFEYGKITRKSPEADVPVILIDKILTMCGGAANVALNIKHLGGDPILISSIGEDSEGKTLLTELKKQNINTKSIFANKKPTITKKRILVDGKHFARVDKENLSKSKLRDEEKIINFFKKNIKTIDVLIFSDYCKGLITQKIVTEICKLASERNIPIIVDTKPATAKFYKDKNINLMTPNEKESLDISGEKDFDEAVKYLRKNYKGNLLVTRGEHGMALFEKESITNIKAMSKKVVDVSGCGDTVVSTLALALGAKFSILESVNIANYAASIVVQKVGTATISPKEFLKNTYAK